MKKVMVLFALSTNCISLMPSAGWGMDSKNDFKPSVRPRVSSHRYGQMCQAESDYTNISAISAPDVVPLEDIYATPQSHELCKGASILLDRRVRKLEIVTQNNRYAANNETTFLTRRVHELERKVNAAEIELAKKKTHSQNIEKELNNIEDTEDIEDTNHTNKASFLKKTKSFFFGTKDSSSRKVEDLEKEVKKLKQNFTGLKTTFNNNAIVDNKNTQAYNSNFHGIHDKLQKVDSQFDQFKDEMFKANKKIDDLTYVVNSIKMATNQYRNQINTIAEIITEEHNSIKKNIETNFLDSSTSSTSSGYLSKTEISHTKSFHKKEKK